MAENTRRKRHAKIIKDSARQRVLIAKDVIAQIESGRITAATGNYVVTAGDRHQFINRSGAPINAAELIADRRCVACARGGILVTMLDRFNALVLRPDESLCDYAGAEQGRTEAAYVAQLFPDAAEIEVAFEGHSPSNEAPADDRWVDQFQSPKARLLAIMRNIVRNDGAFVMEDIR